MTTQLQKYFNHLYVDTSYSLNTVTNLKILTKQIFDFAVNNHHLSESPMDAVRKSNPRKSPNVTKNKQVRTTINQEILYQIEKIFPYGTPYHIPYMLGRYAGLRKGEAFGLAWQDIDFNNHLIYITRQVDIIEKGFVFSGYQKNQIDKNENLNLCKFRTDNCKYNSSRVIPMSFELENFYRKNISANSETDFYTAKDIINIITQE